LLSGATAGEFVLPSPLQAQAYPANFPAERFTANEQVARWMAAYERIAWVTSDSLRLLPDSTRRGLGREWFCFQAGGHWRALYGAYDSVAQRYRIAAHYVVVDSSVRLTSEPLDTTEVTAFGRALYRTRAVLPVFARGNLAFNSFVRRGSTREVEVWYLPAWQANGVLVYGAELHYTLDSIGQHITDSDIITGPLRAVRPNRGATVHLEDTTAVAPRIGHLFVLLAYGWAFQRVYIESQRFRTTLYGGQGEPVWLHAVRQESPGISQ
jgi:hypothetical protein